PTVGRAGHVAGRFIPYSSRRVSSHRTGRSGSDPAAAAPGAQDRTDSRDATGMSAALRARAEAHLNVLVQACREHACRRSSATALLDAEGSLSFDRLWLAIQTRAANLDALGIGPGSVVLVRAKHDRDTLQTMLALMLLEACYVPVAAQAS